MAAMKADIREELVRFWAQKGVALCAEAQADGVPCTTVGRQCEACSLAIQALQDSRLPDPLRQLLRTDLPECGP